MGVENILKRIARFHGVELPHGERWHVKLFEQFCPPPAAPLPVLFSGELIRAMDAYRRFRHVIHHAYERDLDYEKMRPRIEGAQGALEGFREQMEQYLAAIERCGETHGRKLYDLKCDLEPNTTPMNERVGYVRVSTGEQKMDLQLDALEEAGCTEIFTDRLSGAKDNRPGLEEAMEYARTGDTLVVWRLDRFGRSLKDLVTKVERLGEKEVGFKSLKENIDTTSSAGKLQFHIFSALAEFERDLNRERTMAGLRAARERGRVGGRPRALSEEDLPQVQALMRDPAVPTRQICERFDISKATLYRYVGPDGARRR